MEHNGISPLFSSSFENHAKNCMIHNCIVETGNAKHFQTYKLRCANTNKKVCYCNISPRSICWMFRIVLWLLILLSLYYCLYKPFFALTKRVKSYYVTFLGNIEFCYRHVLLQCWHSWNGWDEENFTTVVTRQILP